MSIIVAVKKGGKIVMATDSLYSFGSVKVRQKYLSGRSKVHRFGDSYVGLVGASAHDNVFPHLTARFKDELSFDSKEKIFNSYLLMHSILVDEYFLSKQADERTYEPSMIEGLIINRSGIFGIFESREVYEFKTYWAIGSGEEYALGSLFSSYDKLDDAQELAELAVKSACEFDDGCELPLESFCVNI